jgi:hypothetical protein
MKTRILLLTLGALGLALAFHEPASRSSSARASGEVTAAARAMLPGQAQEAAKLAAVTPPQARTLIRRAYLEVSLADSGEGTKRGLASLAAGLASKDAELRRATAEDVESLLVSVAHGHVAVSAENQGELSALVSLYKTHAPEQIQRMRQAFPESPTLAWLQNN